MNKPKEKTPDELCAEKYLEKQYTAAGRLFYTLQEVALGVVFEQRAALAGRLTAEMAALKRATSDANYAEDCAERSRKPRRNSARE